MSPMAAVILCVYYASVAVGLGGLIYATRYALPLLAARLGRTPQRAGYGKRAVIGYMIFLGGMGVGIAALAVAESIGG